MKKEIVIDGVKYLLTPILETNISRAEKLEILAKLLGKAWYHGDFKWESPNERVMQMLMQELGYYPFKDEDDMINKTKIDEWLYDKSIEVIPTR